MTTTKESEDYYDPFDTASQKVEEPKFNSSDYDFDIISDGMAMSSGAVTEEEKKKLVDPFAAGAKLAADFHKNMKVQRVRISESERREMESKYDIALVNDFDDDYALSDDELHAKNKYWDLYRKIANSRKNLRSMSDYIRVCRDAMAFLKAVAKDNVMYDPDEFVEMVLEGKIMLAGFDIPRYKGKNRNNIDWAVVAKYISDPSLNANDADIFDKYSEMTPDEDIDLTESEYRNMMKIVVRDCPELANTVHQKGNKKKVKLIKGGQFDEITQFTDAVTKKEKSVSKITGYNAGSIRGYIEDDIERIKKSTRKRFPSAEKPVFTGDIMSKKDYDDYLKEVEMWEADNEWTTAPNGVAIRKGDNEIREIKNIFEEWGYDVSNMYTESLTERRDKYLEDSRKSININKLKLDAAKKEAQMMLDKYESEEIMKMSSARTWETYKGRKKEIDRLSKEIENAEKLRSKREKMSDKEFAEDIDKQNRKTIKAEKKKEKKKKKKSEESSGKDIDVRSVVMRW